MIEKHDLGSHILYIDRSGRIPRAYRRPKNKPGIVAKAKNFTKAAVHHVRTGRKKATQVQIDERFEICSTCDYLDPKTMQCSKCGCGIKNVVGPVSKLTWADSHCPENFWGAIADASQSEQSSL